MKTFNTLLIFFIVISCSENPSQFQESTKQFYTDENTIDLNGDGKNDIRWEIQYIHGLQNEDMGDELFTLLPINDAKLLYKKNSHSPLFEKGDKIKFDGTDQFIWTGYSLDLASKHTETGLWNGQWAGKTAYLAVKINIEGELHCGWINLTMDTTKQKIIFNHSDYNIKADQDFIIID
jgi:hypothetical protein